MARARDAPGGERAKQFEELYRASYEDLLAYALRRSVVPEAAADVVAETFLIAWRRFGDIPEGAARPWLFGVARRVMANHRRAVSRGVDLAERLRAELGQVEIDESGTDPDLRAAFGSLPGSDQELLRLVAWEELSADELAQTLGCSVNAVRIRLHRARRRLAVALQQPAPQWTTRK